MDVLRRVFLGCIFVCTCIIYRTVFQNSLYIVCILYICNWLVVLTKFTKT